MKFNPELIIASGQIFRAPTADMIDPSDDYELIKRELLKFPELKKPIEAAPDLVIVRQPFIECIISFIVSANNNIKRFSKTLAQMQFDLKWLAERTEDDFKKIGCGYRAAYLVKAAKRLAEMSFDGLCLLDDERLYKELRTVTGVGDKVARCVMLFCFHRLNIVPVDTWLVKAYEAIIGAPQGRSPAKMAAELQARWGRYAGIAQQFVFYYTQHLHGTL